MAVRNVKRTRLAISISTQTQMQTGIQTRGTGRVSLWCRTIVVTEPGAEPEIVGTMITLEEVERATCAAFAIGTAV